MHSLDLHHFREAAAQGPWVWVVGAEGVRGGRQPRRQGLADVGGLFVAALREHFGRAASAIAERQLDLHEGWHQPLASRTIGEALRCAESAQALLAARSFMLHVDYSAQLLGAGFVRLCEQLGLEAHALPPEQRQALDGALRPLFVGPELPARERVEDELRQLLQAAWH